MKDAIVRVSSLTIKNIKNVNYGEIKMPYSQMKVGDTIKSSVLGIYGQNGSGKTALVDAMTFLLFLLTGRSIPDEAIEYINVDEEKAEINVEFQVLKEETTYEVGYRVVLEKEDNHLVIAEETLNSASNKEGKRSNKVVFMEYLRREKDFIFKPQNRLDNLIGRDKEKKTDLIVAKKMAEKSNISYIFGEGSRDIFFNRSSEKFEKYSKIIKALYDFAIRDLFVIDNQYSGFISANLILPMSFRFENNGSGSKGDFVVPLSEPVILDEERKELLFNIVSNINSVLYTIIPNMSLDIKEYGEQLQDNGETGWKVELVSIRKDKKPIPIRMESSGIIKIISILDALIQAFGNPSICLVIDELDAGIYEYMLGELLDIFKNHAKGQLIFTSHNLRALEMLDTESIMFSTVNPNNRYIHMQYVKDTNNFRSMYIRSIMLGGQEEKVYDETDSLKIARAFRKAGREINNAR